MGLGADLSQEGHATRWPYHYVVGLRYADIAEILGGTADGIRNLRKSYPGGGAS